MEVEFTREKLCRESPQELYIRFVVVWVAGVGNVAEEAAGNALPTSTRTAFTRHSEGPCVPHPADSGPSPDVFTMGAKVDGGVDGVDVACGMLGELDGPGPAANAEDSCAHNRSFSSLS